MDDLSDVLPRCEVSGKVAFHKRQAQTHRNWLMRKRRMKLRIYQCRECDYWHLTSERAGNHA